MTPKRSANQKRPKAHGPKWTLSVPTIKPSGARSKTKRDTGAQLATFYVTTQRPRHTSDLNDHHLSSKKMPIKRNPWLPDDIVTLLKFLLVYPAGRGLVELVKAWMNYRQAQTIKIKVGENELTINGAVSNRVLKRRIESFKEIVNGAKYEDIAVKLPKGVRRNIPAKLAKEETDKRS